MKLYELKSTAEVAELERQLDAIYRPLGLDVEFTRHFIQRVLGREEEVTKEEIIAAFQRMKTKFKERLLKARKRGSWDAVLKDFSSDLNIVFKIDRNELVNITIMKKPPNQFKTSGEELRVK